MYRKFLCLVLVLMPLQVFASTSSVSVQRHEAKFQADRLIEFDVSVAGVDLSSAFFDSSDREVVLVLNNGNSTEVFPKVGIVLLDESGAILSVSEYKKKLFFSSNKIKAGKSAEVNLDFSAYLDDFKQVDRLSIILVVPNPKQNKKKPKRNQKARF